MPATAPGARDRLVETMITMMREQGVHAAGINELLTRSHTAKASIYQHFPRGKAELVAEATRVAGDFITERLARQSDLEPAECVDALVAWWEKQLTRTDFRQSCPITAAALSDDDSEGAVTEAARAFGAWADQFNASLVRAGIDEDSARSLARFIIGAMTGAVVWARSERSLGPLADLRRQMHVLIDAAVEESSA